MVLTMPVATPDEFTTRRRRRRSANRPTSRPPARGCVMPERAVEDQLGPVPPQVAEADDAPLPVATHGSPEVPGQLTPPSTAAEPP